MASSTILTMVKDYLHITFTPDDSGARRLENEANDGIAYIQRYCDSAATCEPGTTYAPLLCEYVMRAEAGALATFSVDFAQDILQGRLSTEVGAYADAMGYSDEESSDDESSDEDSSDDDETDETDG